MTAGHVLIELLIVLGTAAVITVLFHALHVPVIIGYILAGIVIGPNVPVPLVGDSELVAVLSELGVILLMFAVGLELRLTTIARIGPAAALTAVFDVAFTLTIGVIVARVFGWSPAAAIFAGACLAISSTMVVSKAFESFNRRWQESTGGFTEIAHAVIVFEELIAILLLAILTSVASGAHVAATKVAIQIGELAAFLAIATVVGLLVVPPLVRWLVRRGGGEPLLIFALALCFGAAVCTEVVGYPVALGALVAGIVVAESGHGHDVFALVRPFRDVFAMMFFISIGMTARPAEIAGHIPTILAFSLVVMIAKPIAITLGNVAGGHGIHVGVRAGVSLAQIGELSFVFAGIGVGSGVAPPSLLAIAVGVALVTTLTSMLATWRSESIANWTAARLPKRLATFISFYEAWLDRLRSRDRAAWLHVRRPVIVLVLDATALTALAIGAAVGGPALGLEGVLGSAATAGVLVLCSLPFATSMVRRIVAIARALAAEVVQTGTLSESSRRVFVLALELGLAVVVGMPMVAVIEPFASTGAIVAGVVMFVLAAVAYRAVVDFDRDVRAGSELILELLRQPSPEAVPHPLVLPGFGPLGSVTIEASAASVGRSLAELDLRARTGATVLAIARGDQCLASPRPHEPLRAGDVIALVGSTDAIAAARAALV